MESDRRPKILIIGDSAWLRLAGELLGTEYEVVTSPTLDDAFQGPRGWRPEAILSDLALHDLPALALLRRVATEEGFASAPVLLAADNPKLAEQPLLKDFPSFRGCLPRNCSQRELTDTIARVIESRRPGTPPAAPSSKAAGGVRYQVLLVDDERSFIQFVDLAVHREDIAFHKADNGAVALERARQLLPDLIVSDMLMPGLTGIELLRELNKEPRLSLIPCILITSTQMKAKQLEILLHEFPSLRYVLQKPLAIEALRTAFGTVLKPAAR